MYMKIRLGVFIAQRNYTVSKINISGFDAVIQHLFPDKTNFELHAAAKQFPEASEEDRAALRTSIVEHGFTETQPIIVYKGKNEIADGRTRWSILKEIGYDQKVPVAFVDFPDDAAAKKFALGQNLGRRHLTRTQRDTMMNDLALDGYDVKELAAMFGVSESLATKITTGSRYAVEEERNVKIVTLVDQGMKQNEVAALVGVNAATVSRVMQKRKNSEIATDGKGWLSDRPNFEPVVKPSEINPLKITGTDSDEEPSKLDIRIERKVAKRVERTLKQERKKLEKTIGERVEAGVQQFIQVKLAPRYGRRIELAEQIIAARKGIMTKSQYRKILSVLHPDVATDEAQKAKLAAVFDLFKSFEAVLLEPKAADLEPIEAVIEEFVAKNKAA